MDSFGWAIGDLTVDAVRPLLCISGTRVLRIVTGTGVVWLTLVVLLA